MNAKENSFYQILTKSVRDAYNRGSRKKWPGKSLNDLAVSRHPNVLAELEAYGWPNIDLAAEFANVSPEIIAAVIEDGEELSYGEIAGLARLYRCSPEYLATPTFQVFDTSTNKGKRRLRELEDLMEQAGDFLQKGICEVCAGTLRDGYQITYAQWKWCCVQIKDELARRQRTEFRRRHCRTARRAAE